RLCPVAREGTADRFGRLVSEAPLPSGTDKAQFADGVLNMILAGAEQFGNVRLDAVTLGLSGDFGENGGYIVAVLRGSYDARALSELARKAKVPAKKVGVVEVFEPGAEGAFFLPSDDLLVFMSSPRGRA